MLLKKNSENQLHIKEEKFMVEKIADDFQETLIIYGLSEKKLVEHIQRNAELYYEKGEPNVTDRVFDKMINQLKQINPSLVSTHSKINLSYSTSYLNLSIYQFENTCVIMVFHIK